MFNFLKKSNKKNIMIEDALLTLKWMESAKKNFDVGDYANAIKRLKLMVEYFESDVQWMKTELGEQKALEAMKQQYQKNNE